MSKEPKGRRTRPLEATFVSCLRDFLSPALYRQVQGLVPQRFKGMVDVRAFSSGRRLVFEEYTEDVYESTHKWMEDIQIFPEGQLGHRDYTDAVLV